MSITIQCQCSRVITVSEALAGQTTRCPACGRRHLIPAIAPEPQPDPAVVAPAEVDYDGECAECGSPLLVGSAYCHECGLPRDETPEPPVEEPEEPAEPAPVAPVSAALPVRPIRVPAAVATARAQVSPQHAPTPTRPGPRGPFAAAAVATPSRDNTCCGPFRAARAEEQGGLRANGFGRFGLTFGIMALLAGVFMLIFAWPVTHDDGGPGLAPQESPPISYHGDDADSPDADAISFYTSVKRDDNGRCISVERTEIRAGEPSDSDVTIIVEEVCPPDGDCDGCDKENGELWHGRPGKWSDDNTLAEPLAERAQKRRDRNVCGNPISKTRIDRTRAVLNLSFGLGVLSLCFALVASLTGFVGILAWRRRKAEAVWALILAAAVSFFIAPALETVTEARIADSNQKAATIDNGDCPHGDLILDEDCDACPWVTSDRIEGEYDENLLEELVPATETDEAAESTESDGEGTRQPLVPLSSGLTDDD